MTFTDILLHTGGYEDEDSRLAWLLAGDRLIGRDTNINNASSHARRENFSLLASHILIPFTYYQIKSVSGIYNASLFAGIIQEVFLEIYDMRFSFYHCH